MLPVRVCTSFTLRAIIAQRLGSPGRLEALQGREPGPEVRPLNRFESVDDAFVGEAPHVLFRGMIWGKSGVVRCGRGGVPTPAVWVVRLETARGGMVTDRSHCATRSFAMTKCGFAGSGTAPKRSLTAWSGGMVQRETGAAGHRRWNRDVGAKNVRGEVGLPPCVRAPCLYLPRCLFPR